MVRVIGVRFKKVGKVYYFDPSEYAVTVGAKVVVETARGVEYGDIAVGPKEVPEDQVVQPLKKVLRLGTEKDAIAAAENKRKEKEAFSIAQKKIESHGLDMNLVDVEYTFDGSKNIFYFTAEGRVDFRELVRDLASVFRTRIEMRQIGVRDEAKLLGGIGPCGRILCCTSFLGDFAPVSIRMAKDQNLSLNPSKISGLCGRLMCCLRYEQETYEAAKKDPTLSPGYMPPVALAADSETRILDDEEEQQRPRPGFRNSDVEYSARIAQAVKERPVRREEAPRSQGLDRPGVLVRPAARPGTPPGRPQGQPKSQGSGAPRRENEPKPNVERAVQGQDRRPQPSQKGPQRPAKPQQSNPAQQPKKGNQPPVQGARQQVDRMPEERVHGEKQHNRPRHHRGNRSKGADKLQNGPTTQQ